ncbi:ferric reduction oxidase 8, mitochondrial [Dorcoceras hygrometricum]|uniref:Ferric reduction oxidase 8, mitochondrial n=1 Tax=Dorcoceras hygrometricum TaxID=472368 RepID=A0A2Z7B019_9LAMI|nr:ferric reduction oxidase 8, mitochondrial [Dorcoceras hygrometricum]
MRRRFDVPLLMQHLMVAAGFVERKSWFLFYYSPEHFVLRSSSISAFVLDEIGGAGFLVSFSVDCYSLEVVERLVKVSVKLLVYEDFWRNLIERSLIVVRFWERSGCLGGELQRLVRTLLRCVVPEKSNAIIRVVTAGFERLPPSCDGLTGSEDHGPMISPVDTPCGYRG